MIKILERLNNEIIKGLKDNLFKPKNVKGITQKENNSKGTCYFDIDKDIRLCVNFFIFNNQVQLSKCSLSKNPFNISITYFKDEVYKKIMKELSLIRLNKILEEKKKETNGVNELIDLLSI